MVGSRSNLEEKDIEALKLFFTNIGFDDFSPDFMKLKNSWISTSELNSQLKEPFPRTKKRLMRLKGFGFLEHHDRKKGELRYNYWCVTHQGLFYILSLLTEKIEIGKFIVCNKKFVHDLDYVYDLMKSDGLEQINDLTRQITKLISTYQYHQIGNLIREWFKDNFDQNYGLNSFKPPFSIPVKSIKK